MKCYLVLDIHPTFKYPEFPPLELKFVPERDDTVNVLHGGFDFNFQVQHRIFHYNVENPDVTFVELYVTLVGKVARDE